MVWIFEQCVDPYGSCIRQYIDAGLNLIVSFLSLWSCIKTYQKHRQITFQSVPLAINFITTLIIFALQISIDEYYNTYLIFMFLELYTYFLLTYALIFLYLRSDKITNSKNISKLNKSFIIGSILIILGTIAISVLSFQDLIKCTSEYWVSTLILCVLQVPIYIATLYYGLKTKKKIVQINKKYQKPVSTLHLFKEDDTYVQLKILQTNLFVMTFSVSILLHISEAIIYFFMDNQSICLPDSNEMSVRNPIQLSIMIISNFTAFFPHLMILIIFWLIPQNINKQSPKSLYIIPKIINTKIDSGYRIDLDQEEIHRKLMS